MVSQLSNPRADRIKALRALTRRAARERTGLFLAEGPQCVREAIAHTPEDVRDVYVTAEARDRLEHLVGAALAADRPVHEVTPEVLAEFSDATSPQGIVAVCRKRAATLDGILSGAPRLIAVLADVRDPGNAGTVIRAADAFGADAVVLSRRSVELWNPKVVRSTVGSLFHVPTVVDADIDDILSALRTAGMATLAADGAGTTLLGEVDLARPHAWILGNEAWGLPEATVAACDAVVRVPIHGRVESLNLAMAATVCLYASSQAPGGGTSVSAPASR